MTSDLLVTTPHWRSAYWRCWAATSRWRAANSRWRAAWFAFSGPRSRITVLGVLPLLRQFDVWLAAGWATANGACAREPHRPPRWAFLFAPNPLLGRWFGCPGAGPIRACHRAYSPATVLTNEWLLAKPVQRERGPENGHPERRPPPGLNEQWRPTQKPRIRKRLNPCNEQPSPPAPPV